MQDIQKTQFVKTLEDGQTVAAPFLIKFSAVTVGKTGKPYMSLILMDKTGEVDARIWDDVNRYAGEAVQDAFVLTEGKCQIYQGRKQVIIKKLQILREDEVNPADYIAEGVSDPNAQMQRLITIIDSMEDEHYRALARAVLVEDAEIIEMLKIAPAAKSVHHAYRGGLLDHMVSVSQLLDAVSSHYGKLLDRSLLLLGGFFHDIGKLWELSYDRVTEYTDEGKLIGHHVIAVELVSRKVSELKDFPADKAMLIKHVVLAHHGKLEYGSPKRPKCLEALIVHYIDDLDSKINSIQTFIELDQSPGKWTAFHRQFERYFYRTQPSSSAASKLDKH